MLLIEDAITRVDELPPDLFFGTLTDYTMKTTDTFLISAVRSDIGVLFVSCPMRIRPQGWVSEGRQDSLAPAQSGRS